MWRTDEINHKWSNNNHLQRPHYVGALSIEFREQTKPAAGILVDSAWHASRQAQSSNDTPHTTHKRKDMHTSARPVGVNTLWTTQSAAGSFCRRPCSRSTSAQRRSSARWRESTVRIACITVVWSRPPR